MNITPGLYPNMSERIYHSDPAPMPSLSSSCAKTLIDKSPMHAWHEHPRFGGKPFESSDEMEFGELAHKLLLGRGSEIALCPNDTWRGKEAALFWDTAKAANKIPVLQKNLDRANAMSDSVRGQLASMGLDYVLTQGQSEVAGFWKEADVWCRMLADRLIIDENRLRASIFDIKTMSQSAHPRACAARIASMGYDVQRAHYLRGLGAIRPDLAGRIDFTFIFMETSAPFAVTPVTIDGEWSAVGESRWNRALEKWRTCIASNEWPGYAQDVLRLEAPNWALSQEIDAGE